MRFLVLILILGGMMNVKVNLPIIVNNQTSYTVKGTVATFDEKCKVWINGVQTTPIKAEAGFHFEYPLSLGTGINNVQITVKTKNGFYNNWFKIINYTQIKVVTTIGEKNILINDKPFALLSAPIQGYAPVDMMHYLDIPYTITADPESYTFVKDENYITVTTYDMCINGQCYNFKKHKLFQRIGEYLYLSHQVFSKMVAIYYNDDVVTFVRLK